MIYSLTGKIIKKTLNAVVICCGGVGYYAQCPACQGLPLWGSWRKAPERVKSAPAHAVQSG